LKSIDTVDMHVERKCLLVQERPPSTPKLHHGAMHHPMPTVPSKDVQGHASKIQSVPDDSRDRKANVE